MDKTLRECPTTRAAYLRWLVLEAQDTEHQHALTTRRLDADFVSLPFHFHVPHGVLLHEAAAVAVDSRNRVYCFNRGNIPLLVFNADGTHVRSWGTATPFAGGDADASGHMRWSGSEFVKPHGITIDNDEYMWLVDVGAHTITKCTLSGERLLMLGRVRSVHTDRGGRGERQVPPSQYAPQCELFT